MNRRLFLHRLGLSGVVAVAAPVLARLAPDEGPVTTVVAQEAELAPARLQTGMLVTNNGTQWSTGTVLTLSEAQMAALKTAAEEAVAHARDEIAPFLTWNPA